MSVGKPVLLTAEGRAALILEMRELIDTKRPEIVERVAIARAEGDLRENFAYHDARHELGLVDGRVQTIERMLRHAVVVAAAAYDGTTCPPLSMRRPNCMKGPADPKAGRCIRRGLAGRDSR